MPKKTAKMVPFSVTMPPHVEVKYYDGGINVRL